MIVCLLRHGSATQRGDEMMKRKILLIVCDGLGDRPTPDLGGKTPLQAALKPNIDMVAGKAMHGLIYTISPGVVPGSDTSHLSLLGYDPRDFYTGRGPFEALGAGMKLKPGEVAFRCNFATVDGKGVITDRRAGRIREPETAELASLVSDMHINGAHVRFKESTEHRCVLVIGGKGLGPKVSDTDPGSTGMPLQLSKGKDAASAKTAKILNEFTRIAGKAFSDSAINRDRIKQGLPPANAVVARSGGTFPSIEPFREKHGLKFGAVAAEGLIIGLCKALGGEVVTPPGATAGMDTNLRAKGKAALAMLREKDFVLVHVKPTDIAGHDGNARGKVDILQRTDAMLGDIISKAGDDVVLAITGDHSTPVSAKEHTCDPVPLMVFASGLRPDGIPAFDEISASTGSLNWLKGPELMPLLKGYAGWNEKYGA